MKAHLSIGGHQPARVWRRFKDPLCFLS